MPSGDAARLAADWRDRIPADLAALARAWAKPARMDRDDPDRNQDAPAEMVGVTVADELVVHGWDVAQATGQPYTAEPVLVGAAQTSWVSSSVPTLRRGRRWPSARRGR